MSFATVAMIIGGATLGSAAIGAYSSNKAAKAQANAANQANDAQLQMFERQNELQEPFRQAGLSSTNRLLDLLGLSENTGAQGYGSLNKPFGMSDFQQDPGYGFRLSQGLKALNNTAAARGQLISGNQLMAAQDYGQQAASQEYQNAFNRYQINRGNVLNPLQSMSGQGQSATNLMTDAAGAYGQQYANNVQNAANARASGYMGTANAISGGIGQYLNYQNSQNWLSKINPSGMSAASTPVGWSSGGQYVPYGPDPYGLGNT